MGVGVLEITLEKTNSSDPNFDVGQEDTARVSKTLGMDIVSQVQGQKLQHNGRFSTISVWMAPGVNLDKFCKDVSIKVTSNVMTGIIRPAGKKDVTVTIDGLDWNTPDNLPGHPLHGVIQAQHPANVCTPPCQVISGCKMF